MTVRRWKRAILGANLVVGACAVAAAIWIVLDAPAAVAAPEPRLLRVDPRGALGDPRELESAIVGAALAPVERVVVAPPVEPPKVDHERVWIDRAVRVTAFVPSAVVCTLVQKDGDRARDGELWFVGKERTFVRAGRTATLRLESIDAKREVAEILWVELRRGFSLARAGGAARDPRIPDRADPPEDPPEAPVDPPEDPPDEPERTGAASPPTEGPRDSAIATGSGTSVPADAGGAGQVIKLNETRWQLDRTAVQAIQGDAEAHLAALRLAPHLSEGQAAGLRLGEFGTDSLYWRLGLRPGDVALQINEYPLKSLDQVPAIREALRDAPTIELRLRRGLQALTLRYAMGRS